MRLEFKSHAHTHTQQVLRALSQRQQAALLFIIVSLTYTFHWETHTHISGPIYYPSYVQDLLRASVRSVCSAIGRLWGFRANVVLMNTTYCLQSMWNIPVMTVKMDWSHEVCADRMPHSGSIKYFNSSLYFYGWH